MLLDDVLVTTAAMAESIAGGEDAVVENLIARGYSQLRCAMPSNKRLQRTRLKGGLVLIRVRACQGSLAAEAQRYMPYPPERWCKWIGNSLVVVAPFSF
jgi:hypothetical protein